VQAPALYQQDSKSQTEALSAAKAPVSKATLQGKGKETATSHSLWTQKQKSRRVVLNSPVQPPLNSVSGNFKQPNSSSI